MTQAEALDILKTGVNVFLTGEPGAGKSYTVSSYVEYLRSCGIEPAITASTGIAATHIGGMTIHSWSGIGINSFLSKQHLEALAVRARLAERVQKTQVLIIDEVSMLSGATLDLVDKVCRYLRNDQSAFGGIQVIFVGDFFQLPPVSRQGEPVPQFAFASAAWRSAAPTVCYLHEQHRQEDAAFLRILSALRAGAVDEDHVAQLQERQGGAAAAQELVKLYSHNADVDRINLAHLQKLTGKAINYTMGTHGKAPLVEQLKKGCLSPEVLTLKIGARVMFTRNNFDEHYVNGTTGEVVAFTGDNNYPTVQLRNGRRVSVEPETWSIDDDGKVLAAISQLPLRLAWAMTVHKSQGMSLDAAYVDLSGAFAYGQGYVALSRVRTLSGLMLGGLNARALEVDAQVLAADASFREQSDAAVANIDPQSIKEQQEHWLLLHGGTLPTAESLQKRKEQKEKNKNQAGGKKKEKRWVHTLELIKSGKSIAEVAKERSRTPNTIFDHLEELRSLGKLSPEDIAHLKGEQDFSDIHHAFSKVGDEFLKPAFEYLKEEYPYEDIRLARLFFVPTKKVE